MTITFDAWKRERVGLTMVGASLFAIGCMIVLLFSYLHQERQTQLREQGISLARLLSGMSYEQLVPKNGQQGMLSVLGQSNSNPDFAYAAFVTPEGKPIIHVATPGTLVPPLRFSSQPTSWLEEKELIVQNRGTVKEFDAPLYADGNLSGYVRVGYYHPEFGLTNEQLAFFATLALPVFLLTPLFFFLIKKEMRPLKKINSEIEGLIDQRGLQSIEIKAGSELGQFMQRFNQFVEYSQQRISSLESDQVALFTSTKLLSYKRARLESVIQSFPDAVLVLDETGIVTVANPRIGTLLGVNQEKIVGSSPRDWCSDTEVLGLLASSESKAMGAYNGDPVHFSPQHSPGKTLIASALPLFSPSDQSQMLGTLMVFRDATGEQMAKQSRGDFVAHVAHELKSPLNVLAMYSEALQGEEGKSESFRIEASNIIHDEVERLSALIGNILSITKIETGSLGIERQRVKLHDFLQDIFDSVSRAAQDKDLSMHLDLPQDLGAIQADKALLSVAINNLLTNAIKYNRPGGKVVLAVEQNEETIQISVQDSGIGIAPEEQSKVFDKFYRSEADEVRERSGHGLGLSLAREIIQLHHGTIKVHSALGEGTEFTIELMKQSSWV